MSSDCDIPRRKLASTKETPPAVPNTLAAAARSSKDALDLLARANGGRRRRAGDERELTEDLAGAGQIDQLAVDPDLDVPRADQVEVVGGLATLVEDRLSCREPRCARGGRQREELLFVQLVRGERLAQEREDGSRVSFFHADPPVRRSDPAGRAAYIRRSVSWTAGTMTRSWLIPSSAPKRS